MTLATRGLGSRNLIPSAGLGNYGAAIPPDEGGGSGGALKKLGEVIRKDIEGRDFLRVPKRISARQAIEAIPKPIVRAAVKRLKKELGVMAPEVRELLKARAEMQIEAVKAKRIEELNDEALALILIAIGASDE